MRRFITVILVAAAVFGLGLLIDAQSTTHSPRESAPRGSYLITAPGRVEGATPEIELRPQLTERIVEIPVREGQVVEVGAVLLRLDDRLYAHEIAAARAELDLAEAELERLLNGARREEREEAEASYQAAHALAERARLSWERARRLDRGVVSDEDLDHLFYEWQALLARAQTADAHRRLIHAEARVEDVRAAQARVSAAETRLARARTEHDRTVLRAPRAGTVLRILPEIGEFAGPETADPAVILADTTSAFVRAFVEELDAPRVQVGMPATVRADGLPGHEFAGSVVRIGHRMSARELRTYDPTERLDTEVREVWIELDEPPLVAPVPVASANAPTDVGTSGLRGLIVGLRVDVIIDPAHRRDPLAGAREQARAR